MSDAASAVREMMAAAIRDAPATAGVAVYVTEAPEALLPRIEVREPIVADWSAKDWRGRELRTAVVVRVAEGQAGRLGPLRDAIEAVCAGLDANVAEWRVASACFLRSRTTTEGGDVRAVLIEHRLRIMEG